MIVSIANQKGGVGKTTTAINLAAALAMRGKRTLLIDMDPQSNSSMSYLDIRTIERSLYDVLSDSQCALADVIIESNVPNLLVAPARIALAKLEAKLVGEMDAHFRLKDRLDPIRDEYEFIVIDCPPTLGLLTANALVASSHLLVPIQSSYFALEGTDDLLETVEKVRARANPDLRLLGVLITMHDRRTAIARDIRNQIRAVFGELGLRHRHQQERAPRGKPGVQGTDLHVRARLVRRDRVLPAVRGGHRPCLGDQVCPNRSGCATTSTTSPRCLPRPGRRSAGCSPSTRSTRTPTSRGRRWATCPS